MEIIVSEIAAGLLLIIFMFGLKKIGGSGYEIQ